LSIPDYGLEAIRSLRINPETSIAKSRYDAAPARILPVE